MSNFIWTNYLRSYFQSQSIILPHQVMFYFVLHIPSINVIIKGSFSKIITGIQMTFLATCKNCLMTDGILTKYLEFLDFISCSIVIYFWQWTAIPNNIYIHFGILKLKLITKKKINNMVFMQMSLQTKFQFYAANVPHTKQFF